MLILTLILTAIGSFGDAAAQGVVSLTVFRFITGMGVGADLNLVSTYIGELAPARHRGRISVFTFLLGIIGQAVTPFIALGLVPNLYIGWRPLFVIGGVIALIALAGGALGALVMPIIVSELSFFAGFAIIGATGLLAGIIAVAGPAASGLSLERVSL